MASPVDPRFPGEIHALWEILDNEVTWLHGRWIIFRQLYGTSAERIEVLNESAVSFFNILQDVLLHDVQLTLSKLGDPARSGSRENFTLDALRECLLAAGEDAAVDKMKIPMGQFADACKKVRNRRNKAIAHYDLSTILNRHISPIEGPSRAEIESALRALRDVMNCISVHYTDTVNGYEHFSMTADGDALLHQLRCGLRYLELVESETIAQDDYRSLFRGKV